MAPADRAAPCSTTNAAVQKVIHGDADAVLRIRARRRGRLRAGVNQPSFGIPSDARFPTCWPSPTVTPSHRHPQRHRTPSDRRLRQLRRRPRDPGVDHFLRGGAPWRPHPPRRRGPRVRLRPDLWANWTKCSTPPAPKSGRFVSMKNEWKRIFR